MYNPQSVPDEAPEPISFSIDLFPLHDLLNPIPEHDPNPQSPSIDLHPLDELLPPIPQMTPQETSLIVDLHEADDLPQGNAGVNEHLLDHAEDAPLGSAVSDSSKF